jgi:hypothetical protein
MIALMLPIGCADYPQSKEQRPVYSYENVDMGQGGSSQQYRQQDAEYSEHSRRLP